MSGAIPTSDFPGHRDLHERVCSALGRCQESRSVEFKESTSWEKIKIKLVRTLLAMGNLRDGGVVIVGVSEREGKWNLTGITEHDLETYDPDIIKDTVAKYGDPPTKVDVVLVRYSDGNDYLAIQAHEFDSAPIVCKRNGPDGPNLLRMGEFYIRPLGKPRTIKVASAEDMHDLLELAAEKRARMFLEIAHRIGLKPSETSDQMFDDELGGL